MAQIIHGISQYTTNGGGKGLLLSVAAGDLIIIIATYTGVLTIDAAFAFDDNPDGLGAYSAIATVGGSGGHSMRAYVRNSFIGVAATTGFSVPTNTNPAETGSGMSVIRVTGMKVAGPSAIRQFRGASIGNGAMATPVWTSAKQVQNPVIGVVWDSLNAAGIAPTAGYATLFTTSFNTPTARVHIQGTDRGDTTNTLIWGAGSPNMAGAILGFELSTPVPTVMDITPADFKFAAVANAISTKALMTFSPPQLKLTPTTIQLLRKLSFQVSIFDFGRPSIQFAIRNTLDTADFKFLPSAAISVGELWSLDSTTMDFVANDIEMATLVELESTSFDFFTSDLDLVAGPSLDVAIFDFVGQSMLIGSQIALDPAEFNFSGAEVSAAKTITLDVEADGLEFTTLPIDAKNRPPGTVLDLIPGLFNFVPNPLGIKTTVSLDVAHFDFIPAPTGTTSFVKVTLDATTFDFDPTEVNPVAEPVIILLTTANFKFTARLLQLTGISSAGDRKRMLMGVGR